jgi:hypothetical protein
MKPRLKTIRYNGDRCFALAYEDGLTTELDFSDYLIGRRGPMIEPLGEDRFFDTVAAGVDDFLHVVSHVATSLLLMSRGWDGVGGQCGGALALAVAHDDVRWDQF